MSPRYDVEEIQTLQDDFHRGIVGRVSPLGLKKGTPPPFVKSSTNVFYRPARAFSVRPGYRDASQVVLNEVPVSMGKHYHASGNKLYVATNAGSSVGNVWLYTTASRTAQTMPFTPTAQPWRFEMANGLLVGCQLGHAQAPAFYSVANATNTWLSTTLPSPPAAPTFGANAAGGSLTVTKDYFYRYRWNYSNGSSKTSAVSAAKQVVAASGNYTIVVNTPAPASPRADYVGWTLERTKQNGSAAGPFYRVAVNTSGATTYSDGGSDASLFYETDETIHGEPVPMDGVIFHRGRLFGWYGSLLYRSQPIVGEEGTGICNWIGDAIFPVGKDDGDTIQEVVIQGDRLLIGKRHSLWTLEGDDEDSFRLVIRFEGAGFCSPKAAAALGTTVFFAATGGRFFVMRGNGVDPLAAEEVGDYLADMDTGRDAEIIALNYLGDFILFWYVPNNHAYADEVLAYDLKFGNWSHHANMPAVDALVQKDTTDFENATLLIADPTLLPPGNASTSALNPSFVVYNGAAANGQVFVQKYNSDGTAAWGSPVQVSNSVGTDPYAYRMARVCDDGAGGCFVLWHDFRNGLAYDIYGQRLNSAGAIQWAAGGIRMEFETPGASGTAFNLLSLTNDGGTGCVYSFSRWATVSQPRAQKLNAAGAKQWTSTGVLLTTNTEYPYTEPGRCFVNADGSSVFIWQAVNGLSLTRTWAQKLNSAGAIQWAAGGVALLQYGYPGIADMTAVRDDAGGAIEVFANTPSNGIYNSTIYAQRLIAAGSAAWGTAATGFAVSAVATCGPVAAVRDGAGGVIALWGEKAGATYSIMAKRLNNAGATVWGPVTLGTYSDRIARIDAVENGYGGAIFAFTTEPAGAEQQLVVGSVLTGGTAGFTPIQVSATVSGAAFNLSIDARGTRLTTDGAAGANVYWTDDRSAPGTLAGRDVYVQRVKADGTLGFAVGGQALVTTATEQRIQAALFAGTGESEYPAGATAGYHIWCGLSGTRDRASADGSGGDLIDVQVKGHFYDDGLPNHTKDYEWFELYVNRGRGTIIATIEPDVGTVATLALTTDATAPEYDDDLDYDSGLEYGSEGSAKVATGLPKGTEGRSCSVTLSGKLEDMEIGGWMLQAFVLPRKDY